MIPGHSGEAAIANMPLGEQVLVPGSKLLGIGGGGRGFLAPHFRLAAAEKAGLPARSTEESFVAWKQRSHPTAGNRKECAEEDGSGSAAHERIVAADGHTNTSADRGTDSGVPPALPRRANADFLDLILRNRLIAGALPDDDVGIRCRDESSVLNAPIQQVDVCDLAGVDPAQQIPCWRLGVQPGDGKNE